MPDGSAEIKITHADIAAANGDIGSRIKILDPERVALEDQIRVGTSRDEPRPEQGIQIKVDETRATITPPAPDVAEQIRISSGAENTAGRSADSAPAINQPPLRVETETAAQPETVSMFTALRHRLADLFTAGRRKSNDSISGPITPQPDTAPVDIRIPPINTTNRPDSTTAIPSIKVRLQEATTYAPDSSIGDGRTVNGTAVRNEVIDPGPGPGTRAARGLTPAVLRPNPRPEVTILSQPDEAPPEVKILDNPEMVAVEPTSPFRAEPAPQPIPEHLHTGGDGVLEPAAKPALSSTDGLAAAEAQIRASDSHETIGDYVEDWQPSAIQRWLEIGDLHTKYTRVKPESFLAKPKDIPIKANVQNIEALDTELHQFITNPEATHAIVPNLLTYSDMSGRPTITYEEILAPALLSGALLEQIKMTSNPVGFRISVSPGSITFYEGVPLVGRPSFDKDTTPVRTKTTTLEYGGQENKILLKQDGIIVENPELVNKILSFAEQTLNYTVTHELQPESGPSEPTNTLGLEKFSSFREALDNDGALQNVETAFIDSLPNEIKATIDEIGQDKLRYSISRAKTGINPTATYKIEGPDLSLHVIVSSDKVLMRRIHKKDFVVKGNKRYDIRTYRLENENGTRRLYIDGSTDTSGADEPIKDQMITLANQILLAATNGNKKE